MYFNTMFVLHKLGCSCEESLIESRSIEVLKKLKGFRTGRKTLLCKNGYSYSQL